MADYLSNLAAKNLSPQESLRPRPLSRFEPAAEMPAMSPVTEAPQTARQQQIPVRPEEPAGPAPLQEEQIPADKPAAIPRPSEHRSEPRGKSTQPEVPNSAISPPVRIPNYTEQEPPAPAAPAQEIGIPLVQAYRGRLDPPVTTPRRSPARSPASDQSLSPPGEPEPVSPAAGAPAAALPRQRHGPMETSPAAKPEKINSLLPENTLQLDAPAAKASHPRSAPATATRQGPTTAHELRPDVPPLPELTTPMERAELTPTVNVTIGRIEVRASKPPEPPRRKPAPKPTVMSLDEYLQSRSNGGGR